MGERPEAELFDVEELDGQDPFEIEAQAAHLFKHPHLGVDDVAEVWAGDPLFYPAKPPAHWLMVAEVAGRVLMVPLAPSRSGGAGAVRSVVTRPLRASPRNTGGTDDREPHEP